MQLIFSLFFALFALSSPLNAASSYNTLTIENSNIEIWVPIPENCIEKELDFADFFYFDPREFGRTFCFNFLLSPNFEMSFFNPNEYTIHITDSGSYVTRTCIDTNSSGNPVYSHMHIGKMGNDVVFFVVASSAKSEEKAIEDCQQMVDDLFWKPRSLSRSK